MSYCTIDEVAEVLRTRVTTTNMDLLQACVDAAGQEWDTKMDRPDDADPVPPAPDSPPLVNRDNVFRAVQWFKANDVAMGGGGYAETGLLTAPTTSWTPMSVRPYKQQWGVA